MVRVHCNVCIHISHTGVSMASENEDIASECSVCMDNKKNHVLILCGHVCVCEECAGKVIFYFHIGNQSMNTVTEEVEVLRKGVIEEVLFVCGSTSENGARDF